MLAYAPHADMLVSMFKKHGMSQIEHDFIRTYVSAMRRDYYLLRSVLTMMNPDDLGIKSITEATKLALQAANLHNEFERQLGDVVDLSAANYHSKTVADEPPLSALADLFSLSFFTVAVTTDDTTSKAKGLFSGEPGTLAEMLQHLQQQSTTLKNSDAAGQFLTLLKMFAAADNEDGSVFAFWSTVADMFKNGAGLAHYGNYGQVYEDGYGNYEEDEAYDEDDDQDDYDDQDYEDDDYID